MSECKRNHAPKHHHRGKSSESRLDKNTILSNLSIAPGQTVLDAGCGNGYMSKEFAKLVGENGKVHALDPDDESIDTLRSETVGTVIDAFVGDITKETKLEESSLDLIYLSTVIHGFSAAEMIGFAEEAKRLLKPGGRLAVVEIKKEQTPFGPPMEIRLSPAELEEAVGLPSILLKDVGDFFYMQVFKK